MTNPVVVSVGVGTRSVTATCAGTYARPPAANNLLVAAVAGSATATANWAVAQHSGTTGWTLVPGSSIGSNGATSFCGVAFFTKVATGSDAVPSFDCTLGSVNIGSWCTIWEIWNPNSSPIDTVGTVAGGATAVSKTSLSVSTSASPSDPGDIVLYATSTAQSTNGPATYSRAGNASADVANDGGNAYNTHFDFQGYWGQRCSTTSVMTMAPALSNAQPVFWSGAIVCILGGTATAPAGAPAPVGGPWTNMGSPATSLDIVCGYVGDVIIVASKVSNATNNVSGVSDSAGLTTGWTKILGPFTDTSASPHTQDIWMGQVTGTGNTTLNFTFSSAIGSAGTEFDAIEFSNGQGSVAGQSDWTTWSSDKGSTQNNTTASTTVSWPAIAPAKINGEIFIGKARIPSGGPYGAVTPAPLGNVKNSNNNPFLFNSGGAVTTSTSASLADQASAASYVVQALVSQAVTFPVAGSSSTASPASGTLGSGMVTAGSSSASSSASGTFTGAIPTAASSVTATVASGTFSGGQLAISGSSPASSYAEGAFTAVYAISGQSSTQSAAYGPAFASSVFVPPPGGSQLPITIYWYDANFNLRGIIPFYSIVATLNYNAAGSWVIVLPYSQDMWNMVMSGDIIIHVDWMGLYQFGGKCEQPEYSDSIPGSRGAGTSPGKFITLSGADYLGIIANRIAYPAPATLWTGQTGTAKDSVTAVACETAIKHYVTNNLGSGAVASRRVAFLTIAADLHRGANVSYTVQFLSGVDLNLMDIIRTLTINGGPLGVKVTKSGAGLVFDCYVPRDLSKTAWFSEALGNLTSVALSITDPTVTNALVQGASTFYEANTTYPSMWDRVEDFVDQSSQTDSVQVQQSGIAALGGGAAGPSLSVTASDIPYLTFGRDYGLGDTVTVEVVPGVTYQDIVSSVTLTADPSQQPPIFVVPTIGASQSVTASDSKIISHLIARVRLLEKKLAAQRG